MIDGKKIDKFIVNKGFLGFELKDGGKKDIKITYMTPWLPISLFITGISIFLFFGIKIKKIFTN